VSRGVGGCDGRGAASGGLGGGVTARVGWAGASASLLRMADATAEGAKGMVGLLEMVCVSPGGRNGDGTGAAGGAAGSGGGSDAAGGSGDGCEGGGEVVMGPTGGSGGSDGVGSGDDDGGGGDGAEVSRGSGRPTCHSKTGHQARRSAIEALAFIQGPSWREHAIVLGSVVAVVAEAGRAAVAKAVARSAAAVAATSAAAAVEIQRAAATAMIATVKVLAVVVVTGRAARVEVWAQRP